MKSSQEKVGRMEVPVKLHCIIPLIPYEHMRGLSCEKGLMVLYFDRDDCHLCDCDGAGLKLPAEPSLSHVTARGPAKKPSFSFSSSFQVQADPTVALLVHTHTRPDRHVTHT